MDESPQAVKVSPDLLARTVKDNQGASVAEIARIYAADLSLALEQAVDANDVQARLATVPLGIDEASRGAQNATHADIMDTLLLAANQPTPGGSLKIDPPVNARPIIGPVENLAA